LIVFPTDAMGGGERVTRSVAHAALESGAFDEVVCFILSRGNTGTLLVLGARQRSKLIFTKSRRRIAGILSLLRFCSVRHFDFVFSSFAEVNAALCLLRRLGLLRTRRLVTRESTMIFERDLGRISSLVGPIVRCYGNQDLIVCQTNRMAESLHLHTGGRLRGLTVTLPNPMDFEALTTNGTKQISAIAKKISPAHTIGRRIVWCGRLVPVKNPLRAIETLAAMHRRGHCDLQLRMVGDGPMRGKVEALVAHLELGEHVELTGFQKIPMSLMAGCQAGLITSDIEGFPNVVVEMCFAGVYGVATTDCAGGLDEVPGVLVAPEKTPDALALTLEAVLSQSSPPPNVASFLAARHPAVFFQRLIDPSRSSRVGRLE
jgi:glycosyltransferase involved in cell wall biosynthesis